ncbi:MAG: hypothetical protein M1831_003811 [Alyxoria varia]|nr:MAG: hypothetical protein M1831_003811 [Alyxoria varia]
MANIDNYVQQPTTNQLEVVTSGSLSGASEKLHNGSTKDDHFGPTCTKRSAPSNPPPKGNHNRSIHQTVPDHRVKLTPEGQLQSEEAGRRLRSLLRPDDTLQFYTSPYRRTRETTDGILRTLTSDSPTPCPFQGNKVRVWEEPRLREQDFGNFQPCGAAMERMWQERADYGHFFYRIPNGESAADAYDRVSGFNESLWRSFEEEDFASVCVLVTHGLMTRVFLMKWYHWKVEYFEDLRNVNHCEFVVMKRNPESHKFILQNELRTWSELKRRAAAEREKPGKGGHEQEHTKSPPAPRKRWGGCPDGCNHEDDEYPKRFKRMNTKDVVPAQATSEHHSEKKSPVARETTHTSPTSISSKRPNQTNTTFQRLRAEEDDEAFPRPSYPSNHSRTQPGDALHDGTTTQANKTRPKPPPSFRRPATGASTSDDDTIDASRNLQPTWLEAGRDFGGSTSGVATPADIGSDTGDEPSSTAANRAIPADVDPAFALRQNRKRRQKASADYGFPTAETGPDDAQENDTDSNRDTDRNENKWINESGMGTGARADALGDQSEDEDGDDEAKNSRDISEDEKRDKSLRGSVY